MKGRQRTIANINTMPILDEIQMKIVNVYGVQLY